MYSVVWIVWDDMCGDVYDGVCCMVLGGSVLYVVLYIWTCII